jgi:hypothetical protein
VSSRRIQLLGALAVTLAVSAAPAAGSQLASLPAQERSPLAGFPLVVPCGFSHRSHDDPIVYPRQPGRSHHHTFFGNRSTDAFSTPASLRGHGQTTCGLSADMSAYWAPTLFVGRKAIKPGVLVATYTRRTSAPVDPLPAGLKMVAGDPTARTAQRSQVTFWSCAFAPGRRTSTIPTCPGTRRALELNVNFPNCWDGARLDSPDHKSHMAYSSGGACPGSHPVEVPSLTLQISYPVAGGRSAVLSSGRFAAHADFLNAWDQGTFAGLVDRYFNS